MSTDQLPPYQGEEKQQGGSGCKWAAFIGLGCSVLLILGIGGCGFFVFGIMEVMKSSDIYKMALEETRNHPAVIAQLGQPIDDGWYLTGNINVENSSGDADISFPVSGPKGSGTVYCQGTKSADTWTIHYLGFEPDDSAGEAVVLISNSP